MIEGVYRDRHPAVERAYLEVVGGSLVVRPVESSAYPDGFVLPTPLPIGRRHLDIGPPMERTSAQVRALSETMDTHVHRLQGDSGDWMIFGEPVTAAFRPDDWGQVEAALREQSVEGVTRGRVPPARPGAWPPEPDGCLLMLGLMLLMLPVPFGLIAVRSINDPVQDWSIFIMAVLVAAGLVSANRLLLRRWPIAFSRWRRRRSSPLSTSSR